MSEELIKIDVASLAIMQRTDLLDAEVAKRYPEIPNAFNSLYAQIQAKASEAKSIIDTFESAETDEERLALSPLAKAVIKEVKPLLGKNGAIEIKASFKERPLQITRLIDGGFNAVKNLGTETINPLEVIAKYADVMQAKEAERLHAERTEQITIMGGEAFLYKYPNGLGNYTPEQFDDVLQDIAGWIKLAKFEAEEAKKQAEAEALKAKADAEKQTIRTARAKQLHTYGAFHDGDLAELPESDFLQLLEKAQADKSEADKQAEALRLETEKKQAKEKAKRDAEAKAEAEKAEALRIEREKAYAIEKAKHDAELAKAQAEAELLRKAKAQAEAEKAQQEKALMGSDADKFKVLVDKAKDLMIFAEAMSKMESEKGQAALDRFTTLAKKLSVDSYEQFNKLR